MTNLIQTHDWFFTTTNEPRGYIQPHALQELWFHTGTACNLSCPFCLEGSKPGDKRLLPMSYEDAEPFINEALSLGVQRFSFTGGEPFVIRDFVRILELAAQHRPCLVLTNGTRPLHSRLNQVNTLRDSAHPISFRISIDYDDETKHDQGRGEGSFAEALSGISMLSELGFEVSVARQMLANEDTEQVNERYRALFARNNIPPETHIVVFPDFSPPFASTDTPEITEHCMTQYQSEQNRQSFMCAYSKMMIKTEAGMRVYACTLVDDNEAYDLGDSLTRSMAARIMLKHHRCYSCFAYGASCSA